MPGLEDFFTVGATRLFLPASTNATGWDRQNAHLTPSIAIDERATSSPSLRARELRRIWYDYLGHGLADRVRLLIAESSGGAFNPAVER